MDDTVTLFHSPNTRSSSIRTLLEELAAPYEIHLLDIKAGEQREAPYLAINPMGKVPAISHHGTVVTEQAGIVIYLADAFAKAGLAPALTDPARGTYLRWITFYAGCFEPAIVDKALKREPGMMAMSPYGDFDITLDAVVGALKPGPWILGDTFSAADVLWGGALTWITRFGLIPERPEITAYIGRFNARPVVEKTKSLEAALAASQEAARMSAVEKPKT